MSEKQNKTQRKCTSIGGQAVMEGVMMQGATSYCTAVRDPDGAIQVERLRLNRSPAATKASRIPFVRGVVNMVSSLIRGTKTLMRSAQVAAGDDEEPGRVERWLAEKFKLDLMEVATAIAAIVGVALAVALFMIAPQMAVSALTGAVPALAGTIWEYALLGVFKLVIFLVYLGLILFLKDIQRLYRYHGAEHKTINCYEQGLPLTPENVRSCSRIHDRCGTSFLFIVLIINIVIISLVYWGVGVTPERIPSGALRFLARLGIEIVLLPVIAGVGYEILKLLAKFHGPVSLVLKSPGILLQKVFTTREPDTEMIEVAIAAFNAALAMDENPDMPETHFIVGGILSPMLAETKKLFAEKGIDESDAEWIYSLVLGIKRSELEDKERVVRPTEAKKIEEIIEKRLTGRPLWYIIGDTDFYGCRIKVDERVLIPRPETEILAEHAIKTAEEGDKVLDLCTGSGCIAIAVAKNCRHVQVTASDVSDAAIMLARENAALNAVEINFVQSDLFSKIHGRFNLIVCNPPYIKSSEIPSLSREVRDFEPRIALDGGDDGLDFYRRLAREIYRYIAKGGMLMLEVGEGQAEEVLKLFEKRDYAMVVKDYSGVDRILKIAF